MYNLIGVKDDNMAVMNYVISAMRAQQFTELDIRDYIIAAQSSDYNYLLDVSNKILDKCNERLVEPE